MVIILAVVLLSCSHAMRCNTAIESENFVGVCQDTWKMLKPLVRPTQAAVGYAWVQYKLDKDFSKAKDAQHEMDDTTIPAVLGPGDAFYIADSHHTLAALDMSGYDSTTVSLNIICDERHKTAEQFWQTLQQKNLAFLVSHPPDSPNALPVKIPHQDIPESFSFDTDQQSLADDPWRALAGYSRKVREVPSAPMCSDGDNKYCMRCFYRGCMDGYQRDGSGVPFIEFRWAYFMNDVTFYQPDLWPSQEQYQDFKNLYTALGTAVMGSIDTAAWMNTAAHAISICRYTRTGQYILPEDLFVPIQPGQNNTLPGFYDGYVKLEKDPSCDSPSC